MPTVASVPAVAAVPAAVPAGTRTAAPDASGCTVTSATLSWGFKESFRSYISGSIAHGSWEALDGASYAAPVFIWDDGAGEFSADADAATVAFAGSDRSLDTFTPVTLSSSAPTPTPTPTPTPMPTLGTSAKVTVSPSEGLDPNVENVVTVSGSGFSGVGAAFGAYVLIGETSVWSGGSALPAEGWITQAWVQPNQISGGSFTVTLTIPAGALVPGKTYQVVTSAAHGLSATDRSLDT